MSASMQQEFWTKTALSTLAAGVLTYLGILLVGPITDLELPRIIYSGIALAATALVFLKTKIQASVLGAAGLIVATPAIYFVAIQFSIYTLEWLEAFVGTGSTDFSLSNEGPLMGFAGGWLGGFLFLAAADLALFKKLSWKTSLTYSVLLAVLASAIFGIFFDLNDDIDWSVPFDIVLHSLWQGCAIGLLSTLRPAENS